MINLIQPQIMVLIKLEMQQTMAKEKKKSIKQKKCLIQI